MTPEKQRVAIAEACGHVEPACWGNLGWLSKAGNGKAEFVPNYPADLNAMHEAEKVLTATQAIRYADELIEMLAGFRPRESTVRMSVAGIFKVSHATAAQRAEAFLRTIGKWKEE